MADYLATYETPGTGAVMQVEVNFAGQRHDLPNDPAPYLDAANVKAMIVTEATSTTVEVVRDITITLVNSTTFRTDEIVPLGTVLRVYRITDIEFPVVDFVSLQVVSEADLDLQARQTLYAVMESRDAATRAQVYANFAQSVSVEANASAKDAVEKAGAAVRTADAAALAATNAVQVANQANTKSDEALAAAAAAEEHATNVETLAQSAQEAAAAAQQEATDARLAAENAVNIANGVDGKADAALEAAQRADTNAAQALSVANGIAATAEAARVTANEAKDAADNAVSVAGAVDAKAQSALDTATEAKTTADGVEVRVSGTEDVIKSLGTASKGTLTISLQDATVGRVLKVGDFGFGVRIAALSQDVNTLKSEGRYAMFAPVNGPVLPDGPLGALEVYKYSDTWIIQVLHDARSASSYVRAFIDGKDWSPWKKQLNVDDLGIVTSLATTVSQQSGRLTALEARQDPIGVNQTWQNMTAHRAWNTSYTNTTGRPIYIAVRWNQSAGSTCYLLVDNLEVGRGMQYNVEGGGAMSAIIPAGSVYRATGANTLSSWMELRQA